MHAVRISVSLEISGDLRLAEDLLQLSLPGLHILDTLEKGSALLECQQRKGEREGKSMSVVGRHGHTSCLRAQGDAGWRRDLTLQAVTVSGSGPPDGCSGDPLGRGKKIGELPFTFVFVYLKSCCVFRMFQNIQDINIQL